MATYGPKTLGPPLQTAAWVPLFDIIRVHYVRCPGKRCSALRCISFDLACLLFDFVFVYARYHCEFYGANSVANIITLILCAHHRHRA